MKTIITGLAITCIVMAPFGLDAQAAERASRWSLEVTADGAIPLAKLGGAELTTGGGLGANVQVRLRPHLQAYAGWEWHRFTSDSLAPPATLDVEETGYTVGLRFSHPFSGEAMQDASGRGMPGYWLRAGALYNHLELEDSTGNLVTDSKHGLGWEVGAGVQWPITRRLALTPGLRVRWLPRELTLNGVTRDVTLNYLTIMVGAVIRL